MIRNTAPQPSPYRAAALMPRAVCMLALLLVAPMLSLLGGCAPTRMGGEKSVDRALNDLRSENFELKDQITRLEQQLEARIAQLEAHEADTQRSVPVAGVKPSDLPRVVRIRFGRYSGFLDTSSNQRDDTLRIYLQTFDQENRFIPVAGVATLQAVAIVPSRDPIVLVSTEFDLKTLSATYRAGITGTHYSLEVPLPDDLPDTLTHATVKVTLTDAATGHTVSHEQALPLRVR